MPLEPKPRKEVDRYTARNIRFYATVAATILQLQYSCQGRNGLTDLLRKRGFRSRREIQAEKHSLKALRGDFVVFNELSDPVERARRCLDLFL